jgi:D-sedoheptulose 7-phosphate isomerase
MTDRFARIEAYAEQSARTLEHSLTSNAEVIDQTALAMVASLKNKGKVLFFGNGGSAADAQHLAAEFVNRFLKDRAPLAGLALTTDSSVITSISNDFGYDQLFSKQILALARPGDVALGISTSGTSANVLAGLKAAREIGCVTVGFCGSNDKEMRRLCDQVVAVESPATPLIQQAHIAIGHLLCEFVEEAMFPEVSE